MSSQKLRIIPLGGLGEVGMNMMAFEYANDIIIIDAGFMFPREEMPGIGMLIPDIEYLRQNKSKLRGIVITHGHQDHIGALPYILPEFPLPVYSTKFTKELLNNELKRGGVRNRVSLHRINPGSKTVLGQFSIDCFNVCHSIPDSVGLVIRTPAGTIVHSGDFKLDQTPIIGKPTDISRLAQLCSKGALLLLSDSTYAELPGYNPSEEIVGEALDKIIDDAPGRIIITTFSSLVSRIQQIINAAANHHRRVFITSRSIESTVKVAIKTGYLTVPEGVLCHLDDFKRLPHNQVIALTSGTQGEPTSALVRIAKREHKQIKIIPGDTIVISATPIPGNETLVSSTIDSLFKQGANVIYDRVAKVHVHGHGGQEELKIMLNLVKPKFFIPIHGEYRHLSLHAKLAQSLNIPKNNIFVLQDGDILELNSEGGTIIGKLRMSEICVNGSMTEKIDGLMIRERKNLSRYGIVIVTVILDAITNRLVGNPTISHKGCISSTNSQPMEQDIRHIVSSIIDSTFIEFPGKASMTQAKRRGLEHKIKTSLQKYFFEKIHHQPVIVPVVIEMESNITSTLANSHSILEEELTSA